MKRVESDKPVGAPAGAGGLLGKLQARNADGLCDFCWPSSTVSQPGHLNAGHPGCDVGGPRPAFALLFHCGQYSGDHPPDRGHSRYCCRTNAGDPLRGHRPFCGRCVCGLRSSGWTGISEYRKFYALHDRDSRVWSSTGSDERFAHFDPAPAALYRHSGHDGSRPRSGSYIIGRRSNIWLDDRYKFIGQGKLFDIIPVPTIIVLVIFILGYIIVNYSRFGRFIYAIGSNPEAARLSGIKVSRVTIGVYLICGLLCGLASTIEGGRLGIVQPAGGSGYELLAIGAVVIGGASLFGGEGSIVATLIGAIIVTTIRNGLNILGVNAFWQYVVNGTVIIIAVAIDQYRRRQ
jgi:hypothetical protein